MENLKRAGAAINPLQTQDGNATSSDPVSFGFSFFGHKVESNPKDLGATANWAIRKTYDSFTGAPSKVFRGFAPIVNWAFSVKNAESSSDDSGRSASNRGDGSTSKNETFRGLGQEALSREKAKDEATKRADLIKHLFSEHPEVEHIKNEGVTLLVTDYAQSDRDAAQVRQEAISAQQNKVNDARNKLKELEQIAKGEDGQLSRHGTQVGSKGEISVAEKALAAEEAKLAELQKQS